MKLHVLGAIRDPLITFERIELSASNLVQTSTTHPSGVRTISGRGLGHVTKFRDTLITLERIEISASNLAQI